MSPVGITSFDRIFQKAEAQAGHQAGGLGRPIGFRDFVRRGSHKRFGGCSGGHIDIVGPGVPSTLEAWERESVASAAESALVAELSAASSVKLFIFALSPKFD